MSQILLVIKRSFVTGAIATACAGSLTNGTAAALTCDSLLKTRAALRAQSLAAKIIAADADVARAYGFVGVTERELLQLLNGGDITESLRLRHSVEHPAFARLRGIRTLSMAEASDLAVRDAWSRSILNLLRPRDALRFVTFLDHLRFEVDRDRRSPSFKAITRALDEAAAPGIGLDHLARVRWLARALRIAWPADFRRGGATERSLVARLSYLPDGAGARLAIGERVADRLRHRRGCYAITRPRLGDVLAIHANSAAVERFLGDIATRAPPDAN